MTARVGASGLALVTLAGLAACRTAAETDVANGDDPIAALGAHVPSTRYERPYWHRVAHGTTRADSALWARAVEACRGAQAAERPNCSAVQTTAMYQRLSAPPAKRPQDVKLGEVP